MWTRFWDWLILQIAGDAPEEHSELMWTISPQNKAHRFAVGRYGHCYEMFVDVAWPHPVDIYVNGKHVAARVDVDSAKKYCDEYENTQFYGREAH